MERNKSNNSWKIFRKNIRGGLKCLLDIKVGINLIPEIFVINYLLGYMSGTLQAVYTCDSLPKDIKLICEQAQQKYVELIKEING